MTVKGQIRQTNRNGLVVAVLLAALVGAAWLGGPALAVPWVITLGLLVAGVALGLLVVAGEVLPGSYLGFGGVTAQGPAASAPPRFVAPGRQTATRAGFGPP